MKKTFAFILLIIFNTQLHAKHNNLRLRTLNPFRWEYHIAVPKAYHAKSEDYFKKDMNEINKDNYEKQSKTSAIDPRLIIISEPVSTRG